MVMKEGHLTKKTNPLMKKRERFIFYKAFCFTINFKHCGASGSNLSCAVCTKNEKGDTLLGVIETQGSVFRHRFFKPE